MPTITFKRLSALIIMLFCFISCKKQKPDFRVVYKHTVGSITEESEIVTYKKEDSFIVQLKINGNASKETILGEGYRPIIPLFVKALDTLSQAQTCNVVDSYTVYVDDIIMHRADRTCEWQGFSRLKHAFFESANQSIQ